MEKESIIRLANEVLINLGRLERIDDFFTCGYQAHSEDKVFSGHSFVSRFLRQLRAAMPDVTVVQTACFLETAERVAWQRTLEGTHLGDMHGIPPSRKKIRWNEMVISRFEGDRIAEEWVVSELAGRLLLHQGRKNN